MKTISVIIPAYNEEKRLNKTLSLWQDFLKIENFDYKITEVIIVDDGSKDKTCQVAKSFSNNLPIKIIEIKPNMGKGRAVKTGVLACNGDFILVYDADAATPPEETNKLFASINEADLVIGSRTTFGSNAKISFHRRFIGLLFHLLCLPLLPKIKDASCGAKLFKKNCAKKIFEQQKINRFAFDIEILWLAKKLNFKTKEISVMWQEIPGSKIKILRDGLEMFISVLGIYKRHLLG